MLFRSLDAQALTDFAVMRGGQTLGCLVSRRLVRGCWLSEIRHGIARCEQYSQGANSIRTARTLFAGSELCSHCSENALGTLSFVSWYACVFVVSLTSLRARVTGALVRSVKGTASRRASLALDWPTRRFWDG